MSRHTSEEQDIAAGGIGFRKLRLADGSIVTASVYIAILPKSYQHWAYLRFKSHGKNMRKYIGNVTTGTRMSSLTLGWQMARQKLFLETSDWSWVEKPKRQKAVPTAVHAADRSQP